MKIRKKTVKVGFWYTEVSKRLFLRVMLISRKGSVELDSISQVNLMLGC
jgi:hypothetical protein